MCLGYTSKATLKMVAKVVLFFKKILVQVASFTIYGFILEKNLR